MGTNCTGVGITSVEDVNGLKGGMKVGKPIHFLVGVSRNHGVRHIRILVFSRSALAAADPNSNQDCFVSQGVDLYSSSTGNAFSMGGVCSLPRAFVSCTLELSIGWRPYGISSLIPDPRNVIGRYSQIDETEFPLPWYSGKPAERKPGMYSERKPGKRSLTSTHHSRQAQHLEIFLQVALGPPNIDWDTDFREIPKSNANTILYEYTRKRVMNIILKPRP